MGRQIDRYARDLRREARQLEVAGPPPELPQDLSIVSAMQFLTCSDRRLSVRRGMRGKRLLEFVGSDPRLLRAVP